MHRLESLIKCLHPHRAPQLPQELQAITTPLDLSKWQSELQGHPDQTYAEFITRGIQYSGYFNHVLVISVAGVYCTHREVQEMLPNKSSEDLEIKTLRSF